MRRRHVVGGWLHVSSWLCCGLSLVFMTKKEDRDDMCVAAHQSWVKNGTTMVVKKSRG